MKFRNRDNGKNGVFDRKTAREKNFAPRLSSIVVLTLTGFAAGAIMLAIQTKVPELARAPGEIITLGHAHQIETLNSGIIKSVLVKEGQHVIKDQVLATLLSPDLERSIKTTEHKLIATTARIETLSYILKHLDPVQIDQGNTPKPVVETSAGYAKSRLYLHKLQTEIAHKRAASLKGILGELEDAQNLMQARILEKEVSVARLETLFTTGSIRRTRVDAEKQALDELRGRLIDASIKLAQTKANYSELRDKPLEQELELREQTLTELFSLRQEEDLLATELATLTDKQQELLIRAPNAGVIQSVDFPRLGEVVEAGITLFELINTDERLVAEIKIGEMDIGHINIGDKVTLKLTTYDTRRYGEITGVIESLSPTVVLNPVDGETFFRGVVTLDNVTIGSGELERSIRVGMTGSAAIVTDERTMIAYLAKPIHRSLERAFGER